MRRVELKGGIELLAGAIRLAAGDFQQETSDQRRGVAGVHQDKVCENARENFELNDAVDAIALRQADLAVDSLAPADVVVGNLTGALLVAQAANITALVGAGGTLVVSGILAEEIDDVRTALSKTLTVVDERAENEWCAIRLERR